MPAMSAQGAAAAGAKPGQPGWAFPPFSAAGLTPAAGFPAHQQAFLQPGGAAGPLQQQQQQVRNLLMPHPACVRARPG